MKCFMFKRVKGIFQIVTFIVTFFLPCITNADQVTLTWNKPDDSRVIGYNIYCGLSGTDFTSIPVETINSADQISCLIFNLEEGQTYNFAATSFDAEDNESDLSETINYLVPAASIDNDGDGYTESDGDANDYDATIYPGAMEICGDGIDQDCDGSDLACAGDSDIQTVVFGDTLDADYPGTVMDTFINLNEEVNYAGEQLNTYTWPENSPANAILFQFDLSQLPPGIQIQSATLSLYQTEAGGDASYDVSVHKVINHDPDIFQVNGYTCDGLNDWTANSACYNNIPLAQADIAPAEDENSLDLSPGYKSWDVTEMVQEWSNDANTNYGLILNSDAVAGADSCRTFASSESIDYSLRPELEVAYTSDSWSLDIDGNGEASALTDGILIIRYLLGFSSDGQEWINGAVASGATRSSADQIENYIKTGLYFLDIDGNGEVYALSDGILVIRYLLGFYSEGPAWINGAVASGATRVSAEEIEAYIKALLP